MVNVINVKGECNMTPRENQFIYRANRGIIHGECTDGRKWYKRSDHAIQDGLRKDYKGVYECSNCHRLVITDHMEREENK